MAWDKTLPANSSKIRVSAGYIRDNWDAIETGGVPYDKIKLERQAGDPTREANYGWVFTKNPGTGFSELYYEDDQSSANVIQLTSSNRLGSPNTAIIGATYTVNGTYLNTQPNFVSAWGRCSSAGGVSGGQHVATNTRNSTGRYTVTTSAVFTSVNFALSLTALQIGSDTPAGINWLTKSYAAGIATVTLEVKNRSGNHVDSNFDIIFFGGVSI